MPHAVRCLALVTCALAVLAGCEGSTYRLEWSVPDTVTLLPGESVALPITVLRVAPVQGEAPITLENAPAGVTLTPAQFSIPEGQDTVSATPTLAVAADTPAQLQTVQELVLVARDPANDIATGVRIALVLLAPPAPQPDFSLAVEPRQLNLNAGTRRPVTVTVTRTAGFTGPLTITLEPPSARIQAEPLTLAAEQTTGTVTVRVEPRTATVPEAFRLVATAEDGRQASTGFTVNIR